MKILIADDNENFSTLVGELLKIHGHDPIIAHDGKEAREFLSENQFDVVISDVYMPGLDGVRFHSYVREFFPDRNIPFIFVSGVDDPYALEGLEDGSKDYFLTKTEVAEKLMPTLQLLEAAISA